MSGRATLIQQETFICAPAAGWPSALSVDLLYELITLIFWVWIGLKPLLVILFSNNPAVATLVRAIGDTSFLAVLLFLVLLDSSRGVPRVESPRTMATVAALALIIWSGLTLLWLPQDLQSVAFGYWGNVFVDFAAMAIVLWRTSPARIVLALTRGFAIGATAFAIGVMLVVGSVGGRLGDSELLHPNMLAAEFSVALLLVGWLLVTCKSHGARVACTISIGVLGTALALTLSKTSLIATGVAMLVLFLNTKVSRRSKAATLLLAGTAALLIFPWVYGRVNTVIDLDQVDTLTGRTEIWAETWQMIEERPWTGHGFMSFRDLGPQLFPENRLVHAHNEWLDTWFTLGFVGVCLLAILYAAVFKNALGGSVPRAVKLLVLPLLTYLLIRSMTEVNIVSAYDGLPILYLLAKWEKSES